MGIVNVNRFTKCGQLKTDLDGWSVYAAFAKPVGTTGLIKIGMSSIPFKRLYQVHCGSPYPLEVALWTIVGKKSSAMSMERTIQKRLERFKTRGEWLEMDLPSKDDKTLFHSVTKAAFARATGRKLVWNKASLQDIMELHGIQWSKNMR